MVRCKRPFPVRENLQEIRLPVLRNECKINLAELVDSRWTHRLSSNIVASDLALGRLIEEAVSNDQALRGTKFNQMRPVRLRVWLRT